MRSEREFLLAIDCRFPFEHRDTALRTADEGCAISSNAAFGVVHEIVRAPANVSVSSSFRQELLARVWDRLEHPLANVIRPLAELGVREELASIAEALAAMREIEKYPGQLAALCVAYFSAEDEDDRIERADAAIRRAWAERETPSDQSK